MVEKVEPKKQEQPEAKYQCVKCGKNFNEKVAFCPHCGVEFA